MKISRRENPRHVQVSVSEVEGAIAVEQTGIIQLFIHQDEQRSKYVKERSIACWRKKECSKVTSIRLSTKHGRLMTTVKSNSFCDLVLHVHDEYNTKQPSCTLLKRGHFNVKELTPPAAVVLSTPDTGPAGSTLAGQRVRGRRSMPTGS